MRQAHPGRVFHAIRDDRFAILLFLAVRTAVLVALWVITGGDELASDARLQAMLVDAPLAVLLGEADQDVASYAPLQGPLLYPLHLLTAALPPFLAMRVSLLVFEAASFLVLLRLVRHYPLAPAVDLAARWLFVLGPHQILLASVFVQDETIAQCAILFAALTLATGRVVATQWVLAVGVLVGKVFLILPAAFVLLLGPRRRWQVLPLAVVVAVQAMPFVVAAPGANLPYVGFSPDALYGSTSWALASAAVPADVETLKRVSLATAAGALALLALLWWWRDRRPSIEPMTCLGVPVALFLLPFYQHNPEYLAIVWPVAVLACRRVAPFVIAATVVAAAWVPNILYGLRHIGTDLASTADARNRLLGPLVARFDVDLTLLHALSVHVYTLAYAALTVGLVVLSVSRRGPIATPRSDRLPAG